MYVTSFVKARYLCTLNSFHFQWIAPSINWLILSTLLLKFDGSAFAEDYFWVLSDVHKCLGIHWMPTVGLYSQPPCWKSPPNWSMVQASALAIFCDNLSTKSLLVGNFTLNITKLCCNPPLLIISKLYVR